MSNLWKREDVEAILIQLNTQGFPFGNYEFAKRGDGLALLGTGASAYVYEAISKRKFGKRYAIKVIGFDNSYVDSENFRKNILVQKNHSYSSNSIVKVYKSIELRVWITGDNTVERVERVKEGSEEKIGDYLRLQFVLMERLEPVWRKKNFKYSVFPEKLNSYDEREIQKLAFDIGLSLKLLHEQNLIHRDVKLENIFYDFKTKCYKLGDFGIARKTEKGFASTVAFTKGYGAPEVVGTLEDKYDCTADIYSFGMLLYVLMNNYCFPDSENYMPNVNQYTQGYVAPAPCNGSEELIRIVLKMINFYPGDRYQSVEEVLNELEKIKYGYRMKYKREQDDISLIFGIMFAVTGTGIWKLSFDCDLGYGSSIWIYIFFAMCIGKSVLKYFVKDTSVLSLAIFGVGMYLTFSTGFEFWKLVAVVIVALFSDSLTGIIGCMAMSALVVNEIMRHNSLFVENYSEYRWIAVLLLSLAVVLIYMHYLLKEREMKIVYFYLVGKIYYGFVILVYGALALYNYTIVDIQNEWVLSWNPSLVGIGGLAFFAIWIIREWGFTVLEKMSKRLN